LKQNVFLYFGYARQKKNWPKIDLFTAMLSGNEMANLSVLVIAYSPLSCPQLVLGFRNFMVFIISLLSVGRKYREV